jgi:hypothetical protein
MLCNALPAHMAKAKLCRWHFSDIGPAKVGDRRVHSRHAIERSRLDAILANDPFGKNGFADYEIIEVAPSMADERLSFLLEKA